ncbi:MAG: cytochrome c, partial [Bacteroidetes bacterium]|nr:cytochrome c [Bacteroidota bacterium]
MIKLKTLLVISIIIPVLFTNCTSQNSDPFQTVYQTNCVACHGDKLQGTPQGPALIGTELKNGETNAELIKSIKEGNPEKGMPAFSAMLTDTEIKQIAI